MLGFPKTAETAVWRNTLIFLLLGSVVVVQYLYDPEKVGKIPVQFAPSPRLVRAFDLGLHSALASFLWIDTRTELPFLPNGYEKFRSDLDLINALDPKFSAPYAFAVLLLPETKYSQRVRAAVEIGERGVTEADPNWQIPFYLAVTYHLYLKDNLNAAKYFDVASRTPGIPETVRRFAMNYGLYPSIRERTKQIWKTIYKTSSNEFMKERALAYIIHFEIVDYLQRAVGVYKERYKTYPKSIDDLLSEKVIWGIPKDPFGLEFMLYDQGIVGIKPA